jgi:hypothetical protein
MTLGEQDGVPEELDGPTHPPKSLELPLPPHQTFSSPSDPQL